MPAHLLVGAYDHGHSCDERQRLPWKPQRSIASWNDTYLYPTQDTIWQLRSEAPRRGDIADAEVNMHEYATINCRCICAAVLANSSPREICW
jgi:hypothetical protein